MTKSKKKLAEKPTLEQKLKAFKLYLELMREYTKNVSDKSFFIPWWQENYREAMNISSLLHSFSHYRFVYTPSTISPAKENYSSFSRIHILTSLAFRLDDFSKINGGHHEDGERNNVIRICLTEHGDVYLEWYETVIEVTDDTFVRRVKSAEHHIFTNEEPCQAFIKMNLLIEKIPSILDDITSECRRLVDEYLEEKRIELSASRQLQTRMKATARILKT